jgi:hypothetical protein
MVLWAETNSQNRNQWKMLDRRVFWAASRNLAAKIPIKQLSAAHGISLNLAG